MHLLPERRTWKEPHAFALKPVADWRDFDAGHFISAGGSGLLFNLMNVMSTVSASMTTSLTRTTSFFIEEGLMLDMALGQQTRHRDSHFSGKTTKEWSKKEYETKSSNSNHAGLTYEMATSRISNCSCSLAEKFE
jgi:hypothetical protein